MQDQTDSKPLAYKLLPLAAAVLLGVLSAGARGKFIPSPIMQAAGFAAALACGCAAALFILFTMRKQVLAQPALIVFTIFLMAVFLFLSSYFASGAVIFTIPDFYTRLTGAPARQQVIAKHWFRGMKHCASVTVKEIPEYLGDICEHQPVPDGTILILDGIRSPLGFHVTRVEPSA